MAKGNKGEKRRTMTRIIALVLCILLAGSAVVAALMSVAYAEESEAATRIGLTIEEDLGAVRAVQATRYENDTGAAISQLLFSIGGNVLRRSGTAQAGDQLDGAYPSGFAPGGVELYEVRVNGEAADWGVLGASESFLRVACDLAPGEAADFSFGYEVLVPEAEGFLGIGEVGWRLAFFYPAHLHYDQALEQYVAVQVGSIASAIYFDEQDFEITVDAPAEYAVAAGGQTRVTALPNGRARTEVSLPNARSAAIALSRRTSAYEREAGAWHLTVHTLRRTKADPVMDVAERALTIFGELLGDVPRSAFTFVETDEPGVNWVHDGVLWLNTDLFAFGQDEALERAVVFGLARQYFGLSASADPSREPWLIDALSRYLTLIYYERAYGHERYLSELNEASLDALNITLPGQPTVDSYLVEFSSRADYQLVIEGRGAAALHELSAMLGEEVLGAALKGYYEKAAHGFGTIAGFAEALNDAGGRELDLLLMEMLTTTGTSDVYVERIE